MMQSRIINSLFVICIVSLTMLVSCFDNSTSSNQTNSFNRSSKRFSTRDNFKLESIEDLQELFTYDENSYPLISAHRGGAVPGFPENAIETFQNIANTMPVIIECDVRLSKDSVLVLMHDETLKRTTNGKGKVSDHTLEELRRLYLKDNDGNLTKFKIPTLEEALKWGKGKVIYCLDVKNDVPYSLLSEVIEKNNAKNFSIVITYSASQAHKLYNINPDILISATIKSENDFRRLVSAGIPDNKIVAFVGTREPDSALVQLLHNHGIKIILGTLGNLDRQAEKKGSQVYAEFIENGADVISTDFPLEAKKAIDFYIRKRKLSSNYINN